MGIEFPLSQTCLNYFIQFIEFLIHHVHCVEQITDLFIADITPVIGSGSTERLSFDLHDCTHHISDIFTYESKSDPHLFPCLNILHALCQVV